MINVSKSKIDIKKIDIKHNFQGKNSQENKYRPVILIANSSWYLCHYRSLLIQEISLKNKLITIAPIDKSSKELSKNSIFIPWRIHRTNDLNFFFE